MKRPTRLNYWQVDNPEVEFALDRFNPDVVKVFGYAYKTNWRVAEWSKHKRKPLLIYSDSNRRAPTSALRGAIKRTVVGRFYRKVDGALFVGDNNFAYHQAFGLPEERLFPGSLPIDQDRILRSVPDRARARREIRERHGIPHDAFVVMFSGKYSARKRPLDVVMAAHLARQKSLPVWSMLVGEGSERATIETYCRTNAVSNCVLTGFVNQSAIPQYYAASDALVVSSEQDPHPLVISEAATLGLPAIVSDRVGCIGAMDTARPGANAIIYPCGDQQKLLDAIECLYRDAARYREMSAAAVEIAETQDVTVAAKDLAAAVQQLHRLGPR